MQFESAWNDYWQQGFGDCLPDDNAMRLALTQFWQEQLKQITFTQRISRIVELGCGAGFLTTILLQHIEQQQYPTEIFALDYSDQAVLEQLWQRSNLNSASAIQLLPNRSIEHTQLDSMCAQLVCANYAFEYADRANAVAEIARILSQNGQFMLFCHHEGGALSTLNQQIVAALDVLLADTDLLAKFAVFFSETSRGLSPQSHLSQAKELINALHVIDTRWHGGLQKSGFIEALLPLFRPQNPQVCTMWRQLVSSYAQYNVRIKHQLLAQLDEKDVSQLYDLFAVNQCELTSVEPFQWQGNAIGVMLKGFKK